jgi:glucose-1-phosphate cytidylyltransferase
MKVVLLAGGFGTRISEESIYKPKPMIEIGGKPILWHIMKLYSHFGYNDFVICAGYKQHIIKEWFADYYLHNTDVTFDLQMNSMSVHTNYSEPWKVTIVDTGLNTQTGGRIKRIQKYIGDEPFLLTYGDGVANVDINELVEYHYKHKKMATISVYNVEQRFGVVDINDNDLVEAFREKSKNDGSLVNIGYAVCNPDVFDMIKGDDTVFEKSTLRNLSEMHDLVAYRHNGFWQCMDTVREKERLEELWGSGVAPWKLW